jgi:hypothetical protein
MKYYIGKILLKFLDMNDFFKSDRNTGQFTSGVSRLRGVSNLTRRLSGEIKLHVPTNTLNR